MSLPLEKKKKLQVLVEVVVVIIVTDNVSMKPISFY
jgi:hypothetical protein